MNTALKPDFISVPEYLRGEEESDVRHEYISGQVFAMAGGSGAHSLICCNLIAALHARLRGGSCRVFDANMKVYVDLSNDDIFYYPDVMVSCQSIDPTSNYNRHPKLIIEVLSPSTQRVDRVEKFHHYKKVDSLEHYVLVAQDKMEVILFSRAANWKSETFSSGQDELPLAAMALAIPLKEIYQDVPLS